MWGCHLYPPPSFGWCKYWTGRVEGGLGTCKYVVLGARMSFRDVNKQAWTPKDCITLISFGDSSDDSSKFRRETVKCRCTFVWILNWQAYIVKWPKGQINGASYTVVCYSFHYWSSLYAQRTIVQAHCVIKNCPEAKSLATLNFKLLLKSTT